MSYKKIIILCAVAMAKIGLANQHEHIAGFPSTDAFFAAYRQVYGGEIAQMNIQDLLAKDGTPRTSKALYSLFGSAQIENWLAEQRTASFLQSSTSAQSLFGSFASNLARPIN